MQPKSPHSYGKDFVNCVWPSFPADDLGAVTEGSNRLNRIQETIFNLSKSAFRKQ